MKPIFVLLSLMAVSSLSYAKTEKPKVNSIKGQVYYHQIGTWSDDIFNKDFRIWNAAIGEGSLKGPAHQTLFTVETDAPEGSRLRIQVECSVKAQPCKGKSKVVSESLVEIRNKLSAMKTFVPVLVVDTTYGTYKVTAQVEDVAGKLLSDQKIATIDFAGGE